MAIAIFNDPTLPRSKAPHSNAVRTGNLLFVSGFPGYDGDVQIAKGDFPVQMRLAMTNMLRAVAYAGSSIERVVKVNVYLDERSDFDRMNDIYQEFFGRDPARWPARTTIGAQLPRRDFLVEIDCIAEVD